MLLQQRWASFMVIFGTFICTTSDKCIYSQSGTNFFENEKLMSYLLLDNY